LTLDFRNVKITARRDVAFAAAIKWRAGIDPNRKLGR
jgi:hypothetical protein